MNRAAINTARARFVHSSALVLPLLCVVAWFAWAGSRPGLSERLSLGERLYAPPAPMTVSDERLDAALQRVASEALGEREGAIIVMDAQTGRLRALLNPRLAFEQAASPGSTIKPFTALSALRSGLIDEDARLLCRERYDAEDLHAHCSHPKIGAPFGPAQALAYSCNYYFAKLGERTTHDSFNATLRAFGFGARSAGGGDADRLEASGRLPLGRWRVSSAIGEGGELLVTPVQLIAAYAALFNGGHLYAPRAAPALDFNPEERARLVIAPAHRALLVEGMRGAITYGTAEKAHLDQLAPYIFGKTGTATSSDGYSTDGWFIGFAADDGNQKEDAAAERVSLTVLVYLKGAHGAESALLARPIFEEFASLGKDAGMGQQLAASPATAAAQGSQPDPVSVHLVSEARTETLALEDYVLGVMAAEGSTEDELESLKALAVSVRTFALRNRGRHAREGFDFCSTTHCQRYPSDTGMVEGASATMRRAVAETSGEVLLDEQRRVADAYFSAACGGMTANRATLWGTPNAPAYLRGVADPQCATMPHRDWTDVIDSAQLRRALRSDSRTDVGSRLDNIVITRRDRTGRAELVRLEGERSRVVRGWDFKIVVGRILGWNVLKSSRFEVTRAGANYVFRGSGFGHGLGLCQEGAHVMARRGAHYRSILNFYFPGASVGRSDMPPPPPPLQQSGLKAPPETGTHAHTGVESTGTARAWRADVLTRRMTVSTSSTFRHLDLPAYAAARQRDGAFRNQRLSLSSAHFRVGYPAGMERGAVEVVLDTLEAARADMFGRLYAASLKLAEPAMVYVTIHETTGDFTATTGQPWWAVGATKGDRIELQPLEVLRRRGVLKTTLRHEYAHVVIEALGRARWRTPRWLAEGLAMHFAGEGALLARFATKKRISTGELEQGLAHTGAAREMRALYAAAYNEVSALIRAKGEAGAWRRLAHGA